MTSGGDLVGAGAKTAVGRKARRRALHPLAPWCRVWHALRYSRLALAVFPVVLFNEKSAALLRVRRAQGRLSWGEPVNHEVRGSDAVRLPGVR